MQVLHREHVLSCLETSFGFRETDGVAQVREQHAALDEFHHDLELVRLVVHRVAALLHAKRVFDRRQDLNFIFYVVWMFDQAFHDGFACEILVFYL